MWYCERENFVARDDKLKYDFFSLYLYGYDKTTARYTSVFMRHSHKSLETSFVYNNILFLNCIQ